MASGARATAWLGQVVRGICASGGGNSATVRGLWLGVAALTLCTTSACAAVGVVAAGAVVTTIALTAGCYDIVDVDVVDAATGLRVCDATVRARKKSGSESGFSSCFHAELSEGTWTVQAQRPGFRPAATEIVVGGTRRCEPAVQTIVLSLWPVGTQSPAAVPIRPLQPGEAPLTPGSLPAPGGLDGTVPAEPTGAPRTAPAPAARPPTAPAPSSTASFDAPLGAPSALPSSSAAPAPAPVPATSGSAAPPSAAPR